MLQWGIKVEIGRKFSKQFAMNKQAQRVQGGTPASISDDDDSTGSSQGGGGTSGDDSTGSSQGDNGNGESGDGGIE